VKNVCRVLFVGIVANCFLQDLKPYAFAPVNFNRVHDAMYRLETWGERNRHRRRVGATFEYGNTKHSCNNDGHRVSIFELYQPTQSSIAMLQGSPAGSDAANILNQISPATDDGTRGNFKFSGKYEEFSGGLFGRYDFDPDSVMGWFDASIHIPLLHRSVKDVRLVDLTKSITAEDLLVRDIVTTNFSTLVSSLGGQSFRDWSASGVGDVALLVGWNGEFKEVRKRLKRVRLNVHTGITLPTGVKKDENVMASLPLGNDGPVGFPFGGGIDLLFSWKFQLGLDVEFLNLLDDTRTRRIKTDRNQTDFLLLNKAKVRKHYGSTWKFNLYSQSYHFLGGLSLRVAYEHLKHHEDLLTLRTNSFDTAIANTADSLKDWTYHNILLHATYDFFESPARSRFRPQLHFFSKFGINGRRAIIADTFGGEFVLNF
jgi:hypothetical protein